MIVRGRGRAVVTATGTASAMGRVAALMQARTGLTPLQRRMAGVGRALAGTAVVLCAIVLAQGLARGQSAELMIITAISLVVAAVPESLPAVVTLALALGARRMTARNALVRRLPAVETLGSVTVLCTDKTGTLTEGTMVARRLWTPAGEAVITGTGYGPDGQVLRGGQPLDRAAGADVAELLTAAALCNDAALRPPDGDVHDWAAVGDPTEAALLTAARKLGLRPEQLNVAAPRIAELPFDSGRKRMTTVHRRPAGGVRVICKGAPEVILSPPMLAGGPGVAGLARARAQELARDGFRVLAVAAADRPAVPGAAGELEQGLQLLGLVAIVDPPRRAAAATIASCQAAGITPVLITGDHPATARAIATELGILEPGGAVVDCSEPGGPLADLRARVFARAVPEQKLEIISALQAAGDVVAMTGDGVNDGPALRRADIGVAMGKRGTEVARQAADLVLADDELGTVVAAAEEGRRVYANIRRFLLYGLSGGSAEIAVMLAGPALGLPLPLLPAQILWVNLLTHGLPGVALGSEPACPGVMSLPAPAAIRKRPRRGPVAARPPGRPRRGRGHPGRSRLGRCHRPALAEHGLLRPGHHPARCRARLTGTPRHPRQPAAACRGGRRAGTPVRRAVCAAAARPAAHCAADPHRPARGLRAVNARVRRRPAGPPRVPPQACRRSLSRSQPGRPPPVIAERTRTVADMLAGLSRRCPRCRAG